MRAKFIRTERLITSSQFVALFQKAKKQVVFPFVVFSCKNSLAYSRLGIIVPKKNVKRATRRNFFKRLVREWFRLHKNDIISTDVVFMVGKEKTKKDTNKIKENLKKAWELLILK